MIFSHFNIYMYAGPWQILFIIKTNTHHVCQYVTGSRGASACSGDVTVVLIIRSSDVPIYHNWTYKPNGALRFATTINIGWIFSLLLSVTVLFLRSQGINHLIAPWGQQTSLTTCASLMYTASIDLTAGWKQRTVSMWLEWAPTGESVWSHTTTNTEVHKLYCKRLI